MSKIKMVKKVDMVKIDLLRPYENNPRINDHVVPYLMNSIKEFGFLDPIVIDKNYVIAAGHTRLKALIQLRKDGYDIDEVPCVRAENLTEEQLNAYRIADNKINSLALDDVDKLKKELANIHIDMGDFGIVIDEGSLSIDPSGEPCAQTNEHSVYQTPINNESIEEENDSSVESGTSTKINNSYSQSVGHVIYEPKKTNHKPTDLYACNRSFAEVISKVSNPEIRQMLELRAAIFTDFNFPKIADYYAYQATDEEKVAFEKLALVLLDRDQLIENGFSDIINEVKNGTI